MKQKYTVHLVMLDVVRKLTVGHPCMLQRPQTLGTGEQLTVRRMSQGSVKHVKSIFKHMLCTCTFLTMWKLDWAFIVTFIGMYSNCGS